MNEGRSEDSRGVALAGAPWWVRFNTPLVVVAALLSVGFAVPAVNYVDHARSYAGLASYSERQAAEIVRSSLYFDELRVRQLTRDAESAREGAKTERVIGGVLGALAVTCLVGAVLLRRARRRG